MSKIESGKIDLALGQVKSARYITGCMDMCGPLINEKRQQFQISIGQVQHEEVIADGDRLQRLR